MLSEQKSDAPPAYDEDSEYIKKQTDSLSLQPSAQPTVDQCIAHLKFLHSLHILREDVATNDTLYDIRAPNIPLKADADEQGTATMRARVREKRWQVYVTRAVDRFEKWIECCVPPTLQGEPQTPLKTADLTSFGRLQLAMIGRRDSALGSLSNETSLPPLDILMVWHAYLLNPRSFFEDCFRHQSLDFYATFFPWQAINKCIDADTLEYDTSSEAKKKFERDTGLPWNSLDDTSDKLIRCPSCNTTVHASWTKASGYTSTSDEFSTGVGYADEDFKQFCPSCSICLSHPYLRTQKFRRDMQLLLKDDIPLPGTCMGTDGLPIHAAEDTHFLFTSLLARTPLRISLLNACDPGRSNATMDHIKKVIEDGMSNKQYVKEAKSRGGYPSDNDNAIGKEKFSVRKCLSRYWYNSSPFALDLVGAVVRQGSFVDKMFRIDWLHSPSLKSTMSRSCTKYSRFITLMALYPSKTVVPTLDIDLVWHTHQLNPRSYYAHCTTATRKLIDHDDKIEEHDLSTAFEWTSKTYQKRFGEVYSECNCWYCESVREAHTSNSDKLFSRTKHKALQQFHTQHPDLNDDPHLGPHVSAHNVVRTSTSRATAAMHKRRMDYLYNQACTRARKNGYKEPRKDDYMYAYAWGYPLYYPYFMPIYVDPCISSSTAGPTGVYAGDPSSVDNNPGAYGNCAAGTCGGMAAAGGAACSGSQGGCGGGNAGSSCGGGGGGCGGGGCGGGCGGG